MNSSATLEFAAFVAAANPGHGVVTGDPLDEVTSFVREAAAHVAAIEAEIERFRSVEAASFVFCESCSPAGMLVAAWQHVVGRVNELLIAPAKVDVGDVAQFVAAALGERTGQNWGARKKLAAWDAARVRRHFADVVGDPRERRIAELRAYVMKHSHDRPEANWSYHSGEHHATPYSSNGGTRLRLTYHSDHLDELRGLVRYVIHLATGLDPLEISVPPIYGWTDGETEWPRAKVFLRQKKPFPGADWMRFTAGYVVEFGLEPAVLARFQIQWDEAHRDEE